MTPEMLTTLLPYVALLFCVSALVFYRLKRKLRKEKPRNKWEFIEYCVVELGIVGMYFALVAPKWITFWIDLL